MRFSLSSLVRLDIIYDIAGHFPTVAQSSLVGGPTVSMGIICLVLAIRTRFLPVLVQDGHGRVRPSQKPILSLW